MMSQRTRNGYVLPKLMLLALFAFVLIVVQALLRRQDPTSTSNSISIGEVVKDFGSNEQVTEELHADLGTEDVTEQNHLDAKDDTAKKTPSALDALLSIRDRKKDRNKRSSFLSKKRTKHQVVGSLTNSTCLTLGAPNVPNDDWTVRVPSFVLIGAMKGGTQALSFYLRQHPQILKSKHKEAHFFDTKFDQFATESGILQRDARVAYSNFLRDESSRYGDPRIDPNLHILDNSPRYLFWSFLVPQRLFCVTPWVKLLAVLRNPVDRAFSHYNMQINTRKGRAKYASFDTWVENDLQRMRQSGLIQDNWTREEFDSFSASEREQQAWKVYSGQTAGTIRNDAVVGKSMYVIQLRHWFEAMDRVGKPRSDLLILRSEEMRKDPGKVFRRVLNFLHLPNVDRIHLEEQHSGKYQTTMKNETRKKLEAFFEPYNRQLYEMLGSEWFGAWDP